MELGVERYRVEEEREHWVSGRVSADKQGEGTRGGGEGRRQLLQSHISRFSSALRPFYIINAPVELHKTN